jgi:hypothetical protein
MKYFGRRNCFIALTGICFILGMLGGCDSGEKTIDEVTGNRAVKQYYKSREDIEKIAEKQSERLNSIPEDDDEDDGE